MRGRAAGIYGSITNKDDDMLFASLICVEVQRDLWILRDVFDFIGFRLAENEK